MHVPTNVVSVEPTLEPVTIGDVQANAYIVENDEDNGLIRDLIVQARRWVEKAACRSLITQTRIQYYDDMPCSPIYLRYGPVQSVSSFTYTDTSEVTQTVSSTLYDVDIKRIPGRVVVGYGDSWPSSICKPNAVALTYVAGYGSTAASVPIGYRRAIIALCTYWYDNRSAGMYLPDSVEQQVLSIIAAEGRTVEYA